MISVEATGLRRRSHTASGNCHRGKSLHLNKPRRLWQLPFSIVSQGFCRFLNTKAETLDLGHRHGHPVRRYHFAPGRSRARAGSARSRRRRPRARTASAAAPRGAGPARRRAAPCRGPGPARTSASRRSIRSGGVSASASRSSRARSAACSSAASSRAASRGELRAGGGADPALAAARGVEHRRGCGAARRGERRRAQRRAALVALAGSLASARAITASKPGESGPPAAARRGAPRACARRARAGTGPAR